MANYPQVLAQDAVCQSHTGHMTGLWFLPARPIRLNTNEWMILSECEAGIRLHVLYISYDRSKEGSFHWCQITLLMTATACFPHTHARTQASTHRRIYVCVYICNLIFREDIRVRLWFEIHSEPVCNAAAINKTILVVRCCTLHAHVWYFRGTVQQTVRGKKNLS